MYACTQTHTRTHAHRAVLLKRKERPGSWLCCGACTARFSEFTRSGGGASDHAHRMWSAPRAGASPALSCSPAVLLQREEASQPCADSAGLSGSWTVPGQAPGSWCARKAGQGGASPGTRPAAAGAESSAGRRLWPHSVLAECQGGTRSSPQPQDRASSLFCH